MGPSKCILLLAAILNCVFSENAPNIKDFKIAAGTVTANLYKNFRSRSTDNLLFSPVSIAACLAMLSEGASGKTKAALESTTGLTEESREQFGYIIDKLQNKAGSPGVEDLRMINSLWIPITDKMPSNFHAVVKKRYFAETRAADFNQAGKVVNVVNNRISKVTNGLIKELLSTDSVSSDTKLIMTNALYFNGKWMYRFNKEETTEADFINPTGEKVKVNMMNSNVTARAGHACCGVKATVATLPYSPEERFSLVIIVPDDPLGYKEVEEQLFSDQSILAKVVRRISVKEIALSLPRFDMEVTIGLQDALEKMGLGMLFNEQADLPNIIYGQRAVVSAALHKAKITVDEEGTEAAGASVFQITPLMADFDRTREVRADRTFIFTIWDNDNEIPLFVGRVANPTPFQRSRGSQNPKLRQRRQISFKQAKRYFKRAENEAVDPQESEAAPQPTDEQGDEKGVTGSANWWKPTPHPSVLIPVQKPSGFSAQSLSQSSFKRPFIPIEGEAVPVNPNNPPILVGPANLLKPIFNGPVFSGDKSIQKVSAPEGLLSFPGLAVRQPEKTKERDSLVFPSQAA